MNTKSIINDYLVKLLSDIKFDIAKVIEIISAISDNTDDIIRIIGYMSNNISTPLVNDVCLINDSTLSKIKYNIIDNTVEYTGLKSVTRYFSEEDEIPEANTICEDYYNLPDKSRKDDIHIHAVSVSYRISGRMKYDEWQNGK